MQSMGTHTALLEGTIFIDPAQMNTTRISQYCDLFRSGR